MKTYVTNRKNTMHKKDEKQARRATMDRSYRYLRILFGIRDKNGNSFHNLKKRGKKR